MFVFPASDVFIIVVKALQTHPNLFFSDGSFLSSVTWESALPLVSSGTLPGRTLSL